MPRQPINPADLPDRLRYTLDALERAAEHMRDLADSAVPVTSLRHRQRTARGVNELRRLIRVLRNPRL